MQDGIEILREKIKNAPNFPGVYRMFNAAGELLYVGKAKNLKKRLSNYVQDERLSNRIRKMVFETADLVLVETESEVEALLLEISLIKSLKPKYNILFRDDTSYPYILLSSHEIPRLTSYRGTKRHKGLYYGPYPDAKAMYKTIDILERSFLLRTCSDSEFANRSRPCLKYHIKRCSAPCVGKVDKVQYKVLIEQADAFLNGRGDDIQKNLQNKMLEASEAMHFEEAAVYRDRIQSIASVLSSQSTFTSGLKEADILAVFKAHGMSCVQMFSYRNGQHVGNAQFFPKHVDDLSEGEILRLFIAMHYGEKVVPKEIITSHEVDEADILASALSEKYKVHLSVPQKGEKRQLIQKALKNAENALMRKTSEQASWQKQMLDFADILQASCEIKRIECFDISNIQGKHPVASLVVAGEDGMQKSQYRKFAIKDKNTPDDYAMMRETLMRRYKRLLKESDDALKSGEASPVWPDVVMVDGGKGHLSVLESVMDELGLKTDQGPILIAIAKGEFRDKGLETIFRSGYAEPLEITYNSPVKFLLQIIRDESHRFAIGYHRQKRSKEVIRSELDNIQGVGGKRKKALLLTFGSVEGVKNASVSDLMRVEGVSENLALTIFDHFHGS